MSGEGGYSPEEIGLTEKDIQPKEGNDSFLKNEKGSGKSVFAIIMSLGAAFLALAGLADDKDAKIQPKEDPRVAATATANAEYNNNVINRLNADIDANTKKQREELEQRNLNLKKQAAAAQTATATATKLRSNGK